MVINCIGGHLPEPGCSSVCLEGTGCSVGLQRVVDPPSKDHRTRLLFGLPGRHWTMWSIATSGYPLRDVQVCTRLLFSSFGKHWYKVALYSVQPEQGPPNLHQDALQFDWKALECYKFGEHIVVASSIETGWNQVLPGTETRELREQEQDVRRAEDTSLSRSA